MQSFTILLAKIYVLQVAPEQHPDTAVFTTGTGSPLEKRSTLGPWGTGPGAPGLSGAVYHRERGSAVAEGREPPGCSGVPQPTRPGKYCPHQDDPCPQQSLTAAGWAQSHKQISQVQLPHPPATTGTDWGDTAKTGETEGGETVPTIFCLIRPPVFGSSPHPALLILSLWPSRRTPSYAGQLVGSRMPHSGVLPRTQALLL